MPSSPVVLWKDPYTVNAGNTTGTQILATPAGLSDGRYIIAWVDDTNNVDSSSGTDIIAQYYDALGNTIGSAFQLNTFGQLDYETDAEIQALQSGGFVVAYEQNGIDGDTDILYERYDADGNKTAEGAAALGAAGASQVANPTIAVRFTDSYTIRFDRTDLGDTNVRGVTVTQPGDTMGSEYNSGQNSTGFDRRPDAAGSGDGTVMTVYEEEDGPLTSIEYHITNINGTFLNQGQLADDGSDPHVAAIGSNAGYVVTWTVAGGGIYAQIRGTLGDPIKDTFVISDFAGDNEQSSDVVGLKDGGFFVVWYDAADDRIEGRRFDADGNFISNQINIENGASIARPELSLLSDGRVLVTWDDGGDIRSAIVDPRDDAINGTTGDDIITSRHDGATIQGFGGNDIIYGQEGVDLIYGNTGDDEIHGGAGNDSLYGGADDDLLIGGAGADHMNGDTGNNTASYEGSAAGVNVQLQYDIAQGGDATGDTLYLIQNLIGSDQNDTLYGDTGNNIIRGGGGNDHIRGMNGADNLYGDLGDDWLYVDSLDNAALGGGGIDRLIVVNGNGVTNSVGANSIEIATGNIGDDRFYGGAASANLTLIGRSGDDILHGGSGDDYLYGDSGADQLRGGAGVDRLFVDENDTVIDGGAGFDDRIFVQQLASATTGVTVDMAASNVEVAYGNFNDDTFDGSGSTVDLSLYGRNGQDILIGGSDNDRLYGDDNDAAAGDILNGGRGNDYLRGGTNGPGGFAERDQFVFDNDWGNDRIFDFADNGAEKIDFSSVAGITQRSDLTITDGAGFALISYTEGVLWTGTIRVDGVTAAELQNNDFIFT